MKFKITMVFLALLMFAGIAGLASGQNTTKTTHKKARTRSGCLQAGGDAKEYKLATAKGGTWEIESDAVKLGDHVGHAVTITGVVSNAAMHGMKEDAKGEAKEHGMNKNSTERGHLTVRISPWSATLVRSNARCAWMNMPFSPRFTYRPSFFQV
jgi:hypothetical protein